MKLRRFLPILLLAASAFAQDAPEATIIPIKTLQGDSFERLVKLLNVFNARITSDERLRTVIVYSSKDITAQIRKVIAELDRPESEAALGRNIEMTLTLLRCGTKPEAGPPLPADLDAVARLIKSSTQYTNVSLWESLPIRVQEGKVTDQTVLLPNLGADASQGEGTRATLRVAPSRVNPGPPRSVRFDDLRVNIRFQGVTKVPPAKEGERTETHIQYNDVGLNMAGDFKEGQKSVIGKLSGASNDAAIFAVVSLKVLD